MLVRDLMRKLIEMPPEEEVRIDAFGRGTFDIADTEKIINGAVILVTSAQFYERESIHDREELISHFTNLRST